MNDLNQLYQKLLEMDYKNLSEIIHQLPQAEGSQHRTEGTGNADDA